MNPLPSTRHSSSEILVKILGSNLIKGTKPLHFTLISANKQSSHSFFMVTFHLRGLSSVLTSLILRLCCFLHLVLVPVNNNVSVNNKTTYLLLCLFRAKVLVYEYKNNRKLVLEALKNKYYSTVHSSYIRCICAWYNQD